MNKTLTKSANRQIPQLNMPWIESPFFEELLAQSKLDAKTKELVKKFATDGYVILDDLGFADMNKKADQIIDDLVPRYAEKGRVDDSWFFNDRIQDAWTFNQDVKSLATAPKVIELLKALYQREPIPFQTLNFRTGTQQATHSDIIHFSSVPTGFMCGVWIALEDVDINNGPLHYYAGSHKLPAFNLADLGISGSYQSKPYQMYPAYQEFLQSMIELKGLQKMELSIKKGQALIWAANLLHGGSPIKDKKRTRHSQVTHYYFADCMYYIPLLSDPFLNRIHLKSIKNITTGQIVPHIYNGEQLEVHPEEYEIDRLKYKLLQAEQELDVLRPQNLYHQEELSLYRPQVTAFSQELEELRPTLSQYQGELALLKPQLAIHQNELERLRSQLQQSQVKLQNLELEKQSLERTVERERSHQQEQAVLLEQLPELKKQLEAVTAEFAKHEQELNTVRSQYEKAHQESEQLRSQLLVSQDNLTKLEKEWESASQSQIEEFKAQLANSQVEKERFIKLLQEASRELEELRPRMRQAQADLDQLWPRVNNAEFLLQESQAKIQAMESSKFWKFRNKWQGVKKGFGLSAE
jgi:predicted  nucleic acid-binding Zn-ribbon protein